MERQGGKGSATFWVSLSLFMGFRKVVVIPTPSYLPRRVRKEERNCSLEQIFPLSLLAGGWEKVPVSGCGNRLMNVFVL